MRRLVVVVLVAAAPGLVSASGAVAQTAPRPPGATQPQPDPITAPSRAEGATIARIARATTARGRPGGGRRVLRVKAATGWSAQPQSLLVLDSAERDGRQWLKVLLPVRPNGSSGWIPRDRVTLSTTRYWITVRTNRRQVTVYRNGRVKRRFKAVIGKPSTPTPRGLAAVYEINRQPDPRAFLGPWVLSLTALSEQLHNFGGGPGRIGIHGRAGSSRNDPLGSARSHGCIRIDNRPVSWLARHVPRGAPVRITR